MGLFDRFKRRVKEVSDEFDTDELTVEEDSVEGQNWHLQLKQKKRH